MSSIQMRLGYFYSRYPVLSQTFCDAEMLALERLGFELEIGSVHPPLTSLRHEHIANLRAPIHYAPPQEILKISEKMAKAAGRWPGDLVDRHNKKYGPGGKAEQRARNALYFANYFTRRRVDHVHVHFANRAAHTAIFLKEISGIPFSVTAHGQDFMKDLGNDDLLREICAAAEFVAAETDYSRDLLRQRCPESAYKIHRVYNGMNLMRFPEAQQGDTRNSVPRIISIGRLVAFKGFEYLIDACAELSRRALDFTCEIIGDGPLRSDLEARIKKLNLSNRVHLLGSLLQDVVLEKLGSADIFALASITDAQVASDVFPTVIIEAMAAARPVVSTRLAGIPESVVDGETGLLVSPEDTMGLAEALSRLVQDAKLRVRYGWAGRERIEKHFQIEQTVAPLIELLQKTKTPGAATNPTHSSASQSGAATRIAYLIDSWPDKNLPLLGRELEEMKRRQVPILPIVGELNSGIRLREEMGKTAVSLEFLPDAMVIEAEWRANQKLAQKLEEDRAQQNIRGPGAIFLRQARFALVIAKLLRDKNISHVHATSSGALLCALILKKLLTVTVSATIEARPTLSREWIQNAMSECVGGRVRDRKLGRSSSFVIDKTTFRSASQQALGFVTRKSGIDLTAGAHFWQEWADSLMRWAESGKKSRIEDHK